MAINEFEFIAWAQEQLKQSDRDERITVDSGDDTAIIKTPYAQQAITTDMLIDGTHFLLDQQAPELIGRKAINVNVSDVASMGMQPDVAVVSFGIPAELSREQLENIFLGMLDACNTSGTSLVGGDFTRINGPLVINIAMTGKPFKRKPILRSGAMPGDVIAVTGALGGSITQRHLSFTPRLAEAKALTALVTPNAMMDISDGLSSEIHHICNASSTGAWLNGDAIPIHDDAKQLAGDPLEHALCDGEDFELLFTLTPQAWKRTVANWELETPLTAIGIVQGQGYGVKISQGENPPKPLKSSGFVH